MIATLNERFVCSWVIVDDIQRRVGRAHPELARTLHEQHVYPFDFFFFTPRAEYVARLTSFQDLPGAHPAVGHPRRAPEAEHTDVFLEALARHFPPH